MRSPLKALLVTGSLVVASLGGAASAAAATPSPPTLITSNFACSNGVCEIGPGNVGMPFAMGLLTAGQQCGTEGGTIPEVTKVASGSLPPGLQFGGGSAGAAIGGTPTRAGTYSFAVRLANVNFASGEICGPTGTQRLTITIGTGSSDRPAGMGAGWNGHTSTLSIGGWDANVGALWSVSVTSTGRVIFSNLPDRVTSGSPGIVIVQDHVGDPCGFSSCNLTVTNSLGSSVTVTLPLPKY
jgi:hypothetical protein